MESYFPDEFKGVNPAAFWQKQKEKILYELDEIIDEVDLSAEIGRINSYNALQIKPKDFMSDYNDEIKFEKAFEVNCIILSEYANKPIKEMTTKEYFTLLNYRNEINKKHGRQPNKT